MTRRHRRFLEATLDFGRSVQDPRAVSVSKSGLPDYDTVHVFWMIRDWTNGPARY